jgi:hypothetical protein
MNRTAKGALLVGAIALAATAAYATTAPGQSQQTPKGWSYNIKNGKRVPKGDRVTIKERSANGEYKETRQCDPGNNPQ